MDGDVKLLVAYDLFDEDDYGHLDRITRGRVEICSSNKYYIVSGESWDDDEATVVCRQLGYSPYGKDRLLHYVHSMVCWNVFRCSRSNRRELYNWH